MKIRAVTFDVGGTLIDPWPSVGHVYAEVAEKFTGTRFDPDLLTRSFVQAWKRKKNFGYSMDDWSDLVDATFAGLLREPPAKTFFQDLYRRFIDPDTWRVFDDVPPALELLKNRGLKLGVISNWDDRLEPLLRNLGLDRWFECLVVSGPLGVHKPDPEIFRTAAQALGCAPESILHVGDSPIEDLQGAEDAGFCGLLLDRDGRSEDPRRIARLTEISQRVQESRE